MNIKQKKVCLPLEVPSIKYCWKSGVDCCEHFSNNGGHETCGLDIGTPIRCSNGALKPKECLRLKEIK